jgi:hypothetical protein
MLLMLLVNGDLWDISTSDVIFSKAGGIPYEYDEEDSKDNEDDEDNEY